MIFTHKHPLPDGRLHGCSLCLVCVKVFVLYIATSHHEPATLTTKHSSTENGLGEQVPNGGTWGGKKESHTNYREAVATSRERGARPAQWCTKGTRTTLQKKLGLTASRKGQVNAQRGCWAGLVGDAGPPILIL